MNDVTNDTEQLYLEYIEENKEFLKGFHKVYYTEYKEYLKGYRLSDYRMIDLIKANKITGYNNYDEFVELYLKQLSEDIEEAIEIYDAYYECFTYNLKNEIERLKKDFKVTDYDIEVAYEIKVVFQFYIGFLNEKELMKRVALCGVYEVVEKSLENKRYIGGRYAIDIELVNADGGIIAIQSKSYTYLNISKEEKKKHVNKHTRYTTDYENSNTYYVLYKDNKPCYYMKNNELCYLINSKDILNLKQNEIHVGIYEEMMEQMKGMV